MTISRRHALQLSAAAVAAPAILRAHDALASSGSVKVFAWQDYVQPNIAEKFTAETGIALELTTYGSNDEAESTVKANGGKGFDVVFPSITNSTNYVDDAGNSFFAPVPAEVNAAAVIPSFLRDSATLGGVYKGEQILLPFDWGTEGITLNRAALNIDRMPISPSATCGARKPRARRPSARNRSSWAPASISTSSAKCRRTACSTSTSPKKTPRRVWGAVTQWILERKENFGAFWNNATEATAAFKEAGSIIGQTWDTTGLLLNRENADFVYRAPKEGIITWLDSFGMLKQAENPEQAIAFMNFMLQPEVGGMFANNTGYNSAVAGAADFASDDFKRQFNEVYTPEVLGNMWWWQADTPYFAPVRNEFVEIITNA